MLGISLIEHNFNSKGKWMKSILLALSLFSPVAMLAQTPAGTIVSLAVTNQTAYMIFRTEPSHYYVVQRNSSIDPAGWSDLAINVPASSDYTLATIEAGAPAAFYRILEFTGPVFRYDRSYLYQSPYLLAWGLGLAEESYVTVDRPYEWYLNEAMTGSMGPEDCGPAVATMALKWRNPAYNRTVEEARRWSVDRYGQKGWYTGCMTEFLDYNSAPYSLVVFKDPAQVEKLISQGYLLLVCVNTGYLVPNPDGEKHVGRYYDYAGGHYLILKGARRVSGELYIEVYDPSNWKDPYRDGSFKGKNRYLRADQLTIAIANWWGYLILVHPPGAKEYEPEDASQAEVNPQQIIHIWGR